MNAQLRFAQVAALIVGLVLLQATQAEDFLAQDKPVEWKLVNGNQQRIEAAIQERTPEYRLSNIEMYDDGAPQVRYISVFVRNVDNIPFKSALNLDRRTFRDTHEQHARAGFLPLDIEALEQNGEARFSGIWVKDPENRAWTMRFSQTIQEFDASCRSLLKQEYSPIDLEVLTEGDEPRVTSLWVQGLNRGTARVVWERAPDQFGKEMSDWRSEGYRPIDFETYYKGDKSFFAAIYITDSTNSDWDAAWGMKWTEWEPSARKGLAKGMRPIDFMECQRTSCACFGSIWFVPEPSAVDLALKDSPKPASPSAPAPAAPTEPSATPVRDASPESKTPLDVVRLKDVVDPQEIQREQEVQQRAKIAAEALEIQNRRIARLKDLAEEGKITPEQRDAALRLLAAERETLSKTDQAVREQFENLADET